MSALSSSACMLSIPEAFPFFQVFYSLHYFGPPGFICAHFFSLIFCGASIFINDQIVINPEPFKCARARCKTCPFIRNIERVSGPERSIKITDHFICFSAKVFYSITCNFCKKVYIGETGRQLSDRFREHLRVVGKDDKNASESIARHFNLPNHSKQDITVCGLSLHQGSTGSRKL